MQYHSLILPLLLLTACENGPKTSNPKLGEDLPNSMKSALVSENMSHGTKINILNCSKAFKLMGRLPLEGKNPDDFLEFLAGNAKLAHSEGEVEGKAEVALWLYENISIPSSKEKELNYFHGPGPNICNIGFKYGSTNFDFVFEFENGDEIAKIYVKPGTFVKEK